MTLPNPLPALAAEFPLSYKSRSDNILLWRIAAKALAKAIGDQGKVYVFQLSQTFQHRSTEQGLSRKKKQPEHQRSLKRSSWREANKERPPHVQAMYARTPELAGVFGATYFSANRGAANGEN